jgi:hypothetical protein
MLVVDVHHDTQGYGVRENQQTEGHGAPAEQHGAAGDPRSFTGFVQVWSVASHYSPVNPRVPRVCNRDSPPDFLRTVRAPPPSSGLGLVSDVSLSPRDAEPDNDQHDDCGEGEDPSPVWVKRTAVGV